MKTNKLMKIAAAGAVLLAATGCSTLGGSAALKDEPAPPANPNFAAEMNKFNAQFPNDKASKYEEISLNYNNTRKLDERGNCHDLSRHPVIIVLTLDASGKVVRTTTDVEGRKAECFRQAYADAQLPPPPFAPYQKPIRLR